MRVVVCDDCIEDLQTIATLLEQYKESPRYAIFSVEKISGCHCFIQQDFGGETGRYLHIGYDYV